MVTTTDTDALTARIADVLTDHWKRKHSTLLTSGPCSGCSRAAADAVAVEVRKAKAEAWDEGAQAQADTYGGQIDTGPNPYRETGDQR